MLEFLKSIDTIAPITLVDKIKINEVGGTTRAEVSVKSFFAALPTKLPSLTEPLRDLTEAERETLSKISALTQPPFTDIPPSQGEGKIDPFAE